VSTRRSSAGGRLRRRALVTAGLVAAVVLVPGVASAAGDATTPPSTDATGSLIPDTGGGDPVGAVINGLVNGIPGTTGDTGTTGDAGTTGTTGTTGSIDTTGTTGGSGTTAGDLPALDPSALQPLFDALGIPADCAPTITADFEGLIADIPATVQGLLAELLGQLGGGLPTGGLPDVAQVTDPTAGGTVIMQLVGAGHAPDVSSPDPVELPVVTDLQGLFADFLDTCVPSAPAVPTLPAGGSQTPSGTVPVASPADAAPVAAPVQQPATYLGYAPTGGTPAESPNPVPLAVLGGFALVSVLGAAGYRMMSTRGARSR
jgi:hypothetical protein